MATQPCINLYPRPIVSMGSTTDKPIIKLEGDRRGLSSRSLLDKIDGVRELGIDIPLPQVRDPMSCSFWILKLTRHCSSPRSVTSRLANHLASRASLGYPSRVTSASAPDMQPRSPVVETRRSTSKSLSFLVHRPSQRKKNASRVFTAASQLAERWISPMSSPRCAFFL